MYRLFLTCFTFAAACGAPAAVLAQSAQDGSKAINAASEAAGDLAASGVKTASAVAVLPMSVAAAGSVIAGSGLTSTGAVTSQAAVDSAVFASAPLPVGRKVILAQPIPKLPYAAQPAPRR